MTEHHRFAHRAMATTFEAVVAVPEKEKAAALARAAFFIIDRTETLISSWRSDSDISQINAAPVGTPVRVAAETMECLRLARRMRRMTLGLFDISIGRIIAAWKTAAAAGARPDRETIARLLAHPGLERLRLDGRRFEVTREAEAIHLDLGGIGKGFALDLALRELREDWEEDRLLLHAGTSTILTGAPPPGRAGWTVGIGGDRRAIHHRALSASGTAVKGDHIIHPETGFPAPARKRVWALAREAAVADAVSTALMLMTPNQLREFRARHPEIECIH